jgi:oligoendopeptidase F
MRRALPVWTPVALTIALASILAVPTRARERSEVSEQYQWNLGDLYPSEQAWTAARDGIQKRIPAIARLKGRLGGSADSLYTALSYLMDVSRDLQRLGTYAGQITDEDQRIARHVGMKQSAEQLRVDYASASAFVRPEILSIGATRVHSFIAEEKKLEPFRPYLDDILRWAPHTLNAEEEKLVAQAGLLENAGQNVRDVFKNAEMPYPEITLGSGEKVRLDDAAYTQYRQARNRADRIAVFRAFWGAHTQFQGTIGATLAAQTQGHVFDANVHHFKSCVEASLFHDNIPPRVYTQLLSDVHANFPTIDRYLKLRKRMMGLDTLRYEDLYAPVVKSVEMKFTPEQAMDIVLEAVKPLGSEYVETLRKGYHSRWIDWMPTTGKASGAYSTGAYGVHPYQLQNFTGLYDEVGTLAHESGHSMHTLLADTHQPYVTHDYATFVAEVASTLNENLLLHYMLNRTKDRDTRLFLLMSHLDNLRGTLFRQTLFAEFELKIHEMAEKGESLTGESMSKLYLDLVRKYYGHDRHVCRVDSLIAPEWAYIPHFYFDFYVYQYATSIVASTAIANAIRDEAAMPGHPTRRRDAYLKMLSSGSSQYPIDLLKGAGVDMTTSAPFRASMREMNSVMDEIEQLLRK